MDCTDFSKGILLGMLSGGTVMFLLTRLRRRRCTVAGTVLKAAGSVIETVSKAMRI